MRKLLLALVVALVPVLTSPARAAEDLTSLTNADRTAAGLPALVTASDLQSFAQRRAEEMARAGKLWHTSGLGTQITNWQRVGENVGRGPSLREIQAAFMESASHRENIVHPAYTQLGVGVAHDGGQLLYVAVIFRQPKSTAAAAPAPAPAAPAPAPAPRPVVKPKPKPVVAAPATTTTTAAPAPPPPPEAAPAAPPPPPPAPTLQEMVRPFASKLTEQRAFLAANGEEAAVPSPEAGEPGAFAPLMAGALVGLVGVCGGHVRWRRRPIRKLF